MNKREFINRRTNRWQDFEMLLRSLDKLQPKSLPQADLNDFVSNYRLICSDLARARAEQFGSDIEEYLNSLVARGHKHFRRPSRPETKKIVYFFTAEFPQLIRRHKFHVTLSLTLFFLPMIISAYVVYNQPDLAYHLVPLDQLHGLTDAYSEGHGGGRDEDLDSMMTGFYINNNVGIAFRCFATGISFGLGSMFFLLFNGIVLGAVGAYVCGAGYAENFLSFVVGHGAFELTAIAIAGAAGLKMGFLLVNPGSLTRISALIKHGPDTIKIVMGAGAMLTIAAFVEGFWSPSQVPALTKYVVGAILWLSVLVYFVFAGRQNKSKALAHVEGVGGQTDEY